MGLVATMELLEEIKDEIELGKGVEKLEDSLKEKQVKPSDRVGKDGFSLTHWACFYGNARVRKDQAFSHLTSMRI